MLKRWFGFFCLSSFIFSTGMAAGQLPTGWRAHDLSRPQPKVVSPGESKLPPGVPSDAIVLFDGSDLSEWGDKKGGPCKWKIVDGAMVSAPHSGFATTVKKFGDCQLHIEWASPVKVTGKGQGRGNSGIFLMGKYEIQVLDSFENPTYADGGAGAIYGQYPPLVNASRKSGQWQSYDIIFRRPRFGPEGKLKEPATVTVLHNGILIQNNTKILGPTIWLKHDPYVAGPKELPLSLQDHGNPVRYRNIWIRPLAEERLRPEKPYASEIAEVTLSDQDKQSLVGRYGRFRVENQDGALFLHSWGKKFEMLPVSDTRFEFRKTAGYVEFAKDGSGKIASATFHLDATGTRKSNRK